MPEKRRTVKESIVMLLRVVVLKFVVGKGDWGGENVLRSTQSLRC